MNYLKNRKGFTLIEMLVVVGIIGVLASLVLVGLGGAREAGADAKRIANLNQVRNALELYHLANNKYPDGDDVAITSLVTDGLNIGRLELDDDYRYKKDDPSYIIGVLLGGENGGGYQAGGFNIGECNVPGVYCLTAD